MVTHQLNWVGKASLYLTVMLLYGLTFGIAWFAFQSPTNLDHSKSVALTKSVQIPFVPFGPKEVIISGLPVRLTIPGSGVDLTVIPGYYDSSTDLWTLSGYDAQFAMISTQANNVAGQTFIYGHNNNYVFGALRHVTPTIGAQAFIYTSNGHIFAYSFTNDQSVGPNDVSILNYNGPPSLLIQTCTGSLNEWRTEYSFAFNKVVQ